MTEENPNLKITITQDGPYHVTGHIPLNREIAANDGGRDPVRWDKAGEIQAGNVYRLCRCGQSSNKPLCDNTHLEIDFDGTETAENIPYKEMATVVEGPDMVLFDARKYCASGRFCNRAGSAWALTDESDDPESKAIAIQEACDCPGGRLVAYDKKTHKIIEPEYSPQIVVAQDPGRHVSGPLLVRGGIKIVSENGTEYEVRNRVALCRCGRSGNKPFCDGSHIGVRFNDGDPSLAH